MGPSGFVHPEVASALINLGAVQLQLKEIGNARVSIERALAICEEVYGPDHPELVPALINLGIAQMRLKEPEDACASIERALVICEQVYGPDRRKIIRALIDLGIIRHGKVARYLIFFVLMSGGAGHDPEGQ